MIAWSEVARNPAPILPLLQRRFPDLRPQDLLAAGADQDALERKLARRHDLTPREAHQELDDLLFVADLRRRSRPR